MERTSVRQTSGGDGHGEYELLHGWDGSVWRKVKTDASGNLQTSGVAGYPWELDVLIRQDKVSTSTDYIMVIGTVPANKRWNIISMIGYNTTRATTRSYLGIKRDTYYWLSVVSPLAQYVSINWSGSAWLVAGDQVVAYFNGIQIGDNLSGFAIGGQISI